MLENGWSDEDGRFMIFGQLIRRESERKMNNKNNTDFYS